MYANLLLLPCQIFREAFCLPIIIDALLMSVPCSVFVGEETIQGGDVWPDAISQAIRNCKYFVPLISPGYGESEWYGPRL